MDKFECIYRNDFGDEYPEDVKITEDGEFYDVVMTDKKIATLQAKIDALKHEIYVLRQYGNKDCTAIADEVLELKQEKE